MKLQDFILSIIHISDEDATSIASHFQSFTLNKGETILQKGEVSDDYIYLEQGLMRSFLYDLDGHEITTDIFVEKNMVFEVTSFFNRAPSETYMEGITDCKGLKIDYKKLNQLFHDKPAFREFGRAILVREFSASKKRSYAMVNQSAEQRYQNLIAHKPEILKYVPLKYIASYLGVTDSTLSRIRAKI